MPPGGVDSQAIDLTPVPFPHGKGNTSRKRSSGLAIPAAASDDPHASLVIEVRFLTPFPVREGVGG